MRQRSSQNSNLCNPQIVVPNLEVLSSREIRVYRARETQKLSPSQ